MGAKVCKKCGIREDSPYIINNDYRYHCRMHNFILKNEESFFCNDCRCAYDANHNCRHVFVYRLCCFINY